MPMNIYQPQHKSLATLLEMATKDATILIPDLQRPYVWTPKQVITLVDSLLRGWPFGSLLLWNLGPVSVGENMIPSRTFWEIVSRVEGSNDNFDNRIFSSASKPNEFFMVLDGQQRLQSLLLAFGSDQSGLRLLDKDWQLAFHGESPYRGPNVFKHWTKAELYIDLKLLNAQIYTDSDGDSDLIHDVNYASFIRWAFNKSSGENAQNQVTQNQEPKRLEKYFQPLGIVENGSHIRLGKLWKEASFLMNKNDAISKERIREILNAHSVDESLKKCLTKPLLSLIKKLQEAQIQQVQFLELNPLSQSGYSQQDDYNIAIVNIFTRLNQGGQTLSKEEITFAWIKIQWAEAATEIDNLRKEMNSFDEKFRLETDEIVKMLSIIWCAFDVDRKGEILRDKNLLEGKTVKSMASWLKANWKIVSEGLISVLKIVSERQLKFNQHFYSMNALTLLAAWRIAFDILSKERGISGVTKEILLQNASASVAEFAKSWLLLSQWAGLWSKGTDTSVEKYTTSLSSVFLSKIPMDHIEIKDILIKEIQEWMFGLKGNSIKYIEEYLNADDRSSVGGYRAALEIWQDQDDGRRSQAAVTLKTSNNELKKEVDHIVPYKAAEKLKLQFPDKGQELLDIVNSIGNCVLLTKNFNISKKDLPLDKWLQDPKLSDLKYEGGAPFNPEYWKIALAIPSQMSGFNVDLLLTMSEEERNAAVQDCIKEINVRELLIKNGLRSFVGTACQSHGS